MNAHEHHVMPGWQMTTSHYKAEVLDTCAKMFAIRPFLHVQNRDHVDRYLEDVWRLIVTLVWSFDTTPSSYMFQEWFQAYADTEEERLRMALVTVQYNIDGRDTLSLVIGPGRIEKARPSYLNHMLLSLNDAVY